MLRQNRKILIICDQIPFYGGASTIAYLFFKKLRKRNKNVFYLNLIDKNKIKYYKRLFGKLKANPDKDPHVYSCYLKNLYKEKVNGINGLREILNIIEPDIILGFNRFSPYLARESQAKCKIVFMVTSSRQMIDYLDTFKCYSEFKERVIKKKIPPFLRNKIEEKAVMNSDLIICLNRQTRRLYTYFYPDKKFKIYKKNFNNAFISTENFMLKPSDDLLRRFRRRKIDILFVASRWTRIEKGFSLLKEIIKKFPGLNICIVGECLEQVQVVQYPFISSRESIKGLMENSKVFVCPSRYDANPNVIFEAIASGCNVVASQNCGNYRYISPKLVVRNWDIQDFANKIEKALIRPHKPNMKFFSKEDPVVQVDEIIDFILN